MVGGHVWQGGMAGGHALQGWHAWQGGMHAMHTPGHYEIRSVNARALRILLECILVKIIF